jgi:hypothetical protein
MKVFEDYFSELQSDMISMNVGGDGIVDSAMAVRRPAARQHPGYI